MKRHKENADEGPVPSVFRDRRQAGAILAKKLQERYRFAEKPLVLAIPRGGVVTGDEIASRLGADLDVIVSKKVGAPGNPELAVGAVMHDGSFFPNTGIIEVLRVPQAYITQQIAEKKIEIERRLAKFRGGKDYSLEGRTVILTDDGVATGATVFAAINWLKTQKVKKLVVAMPVGPADTLERIRQIVDELVVIHAPEDFAAVGVFYEEFAQVSDDEVVEIMGRWRRRPGLS